jgi:plastocyanin
MIFRTMRCALFAASLCLAASPAVSAADDANTVTIKNFDYTPMAMTVSAGTTVTWHNLDGEPHTIVSVDGLFRSAALDSGETFAFKFTKTGTFKYVCTIHPRMIGTVTVK